MTKTIYHCGSWNRNYGDRLIQLGVRQNYDRAFGAAGIDLRWVDINVPQTRRHDPNASGDEPDHGAWFTSELVDEVNREADLLVVGGGGLIMNREDGPFQVRMCDGGWQAIRVPVVFQSIGWNEFRYNDHIDRDALYEYLIRPLEQRSAPTRFSVRNEYTRERIGYTALQVDVVPDPAICVYPGNYRDIYPRRLRGRFRVALSWASDRVEKRWAGAGDELRSIHSVASALLDADATVYLTPHIVIDHTEDWLDSLKPLGSPKLKVVDVEQYRLSGPTLEKAAGLADLYGRMDLVIGSRKHAVLGPLGQGTPALCICQQPEIESTLREEGLSALYVGDRACPPLRVTSMGWHGRIGHADMRHRFQTWLEQGVLPLVRGPTSARVTT